MKSPESERFLQVIERIISNKKAKNVNEIIKTAKLPNSTVSEIKAGRSAVSVPIIQKLVKAYNINPNYIIIGSDPIFANENSEQITKNSLPLDREIELLKEIIESQRQTIQALKHEKRN